MCFNSLANINRAIVIAPRPVVGHYNHSAIRGTTRVKEDSTFGLRCGNCGFQQSADGRAQPLCIAFDPPHTRFEIGNKLLLLGLCRHIVLGGNPDGLVDDILAAALKTIEEHKETNDKISKKNAQAVNSVLEEKKYFEQKTKEMALVCEIMKEQKEYMQRKLDLNKSELE